MEVPQVLIDARNKLEKEVDAATQELMRQEYSTARAAEKLNSLREYLAVIANAVAILENVAP